MLGIMAVAGAVADLINLAGKWHLKSNYPIVGAVTPTAGGVVFFGDIGGNFYALDAANGQKLWGRSSAAQSAAV